MFSWGSLVLRVSASNCWCEVRLTCLFTGFLRDNAAFGLHLSELLRQNAAASVFASRGVSCSLGVFWPFLQANVAPTSEKSPPKHASTSIRKLRTIVGKTVRNCCVSQCCSDVRLDCVFTALAPPEGYHPLCFRHCLHENPGKRGTKPTTPNGSEPPKTPKPA